MHCLYHCADIIKDAPSSKEFKFCLWRTFRHKTPHATRCITCQLRTPIGKDIPGRPEKRDDIDWEFEVSCLDREVLDQTTVLGELRADIPDDIYKSYMVNNERKKGFNIELTFRLQVNGQGLVIQTFHQEQRLDNRLFAAAIWVDKETIDVDLQRRPQKRRMDQVEAPYEDPAQAEKRPRGGGDDQLLNPEAPADEGEIDTAQERESTRAISTGQTTPYHTAEDHVEEHHTEEAHAEEDHVEEHHVEEDHVEEHHTEEDHTEEDHAEGGHVEGDHVDPAPEGSEQLARELGEYNEQEEVSTPWVRRVLRSSRTPAPLDVGRRRHD